MYKNQLQELAQRSCFNLPSYTHVKEGPDHVPRFKATVNFNGETFVSPSFCSTLRQAEHAAAEVALGALASRTPSNALAAKILDDTGIYKNLLQDVSQRVGGSLPIYRTLPSGHGYRLVFSCTVELVGIRFTGEPAKNKKQAEKNAAMNAWSSLKLLAQQSESSSSGKANNDQQEHVIVAHALQNFLWKARMSKVSFPMKFPIQNPRPLSTESPPMRKSKILPLIRSQAAPQSRPIYAPVKDSLMCPKPACQSKPVTGAVNCNPICRAVAPETQAPTITANDILLAPTKTETQAPNKTESPRVLPQKSYAAARAAPYIPVGHFRQHRAIAPPVTIRTAIPVFSAPPLPTSSLSPQMRGPPPLHITLPVSANRECQFLAPPSAPLKEQLVSMAPVAAAASSSEHIKETEGAVQEKQQEYLVMQQILEELKI
ncbi:double-stranded RNA-binding protein 6-like [Diospyros lotus]|uniref:double-stranded RNA-binding protein 6-like n=1 Tax=Diospyros lotus TaxID=55363 RepID=UPI002251102D|nr:double-stranded RNA-binding protein 6-like [Diospyros lotus]